MDSQPQFGPAEDVGAHCTQASSATVGPSAPSVRRGQDWVLALCALALALLGQFYFRTMRTYLVDGLVFFGAAIALFLTLVRQHEANLEKSAEISWIRRLTLLARSRPVRTVLVILSIILAYTGIRLLRAPSGTGNYWNVFWIWVVSSVSIVAAFTHIPRFDVRAWWLLHRSEIVAVSCLTAIAAFLRLIALGKVPNTISGDEGLVGGLSVAIMKGQLNNMMATIFGHSTMYLYLIAGGMKIFGIDPTGLRITAAVAGALNVPILYVLARRFFNARVATVAAVLLTVSHIHLHFSRIIVAGSIQDALFATIAFYFLYTGLQKRSVTRFALSAFTSGLHIYIYMGARLVILLIPVYLFFLLVTNPELVRDNLSNFLVYIIVLLVVFAPMSVWAITRSQDFWARANQIGVLQSGWLPAEAKRLGRTETQVLLDLLLQAFLTVNYHPANAFYDSPLPILDFYSGSVYMLGLAYSIYHLRDPRHLLLNGWFWSAVVVGGALVIQPAISAYRILIMLPAVCIFIGLGWDLLVKLGTQALRGGKVLGWGVTVVFLLLLAATNLKAYFVDYGPSCLYSSTSSGTRFASFMGEALGKAGPSYKAFLFGYPYIVYGPHKSVDFLSGGIPITDIKEPLTQTVTFVEPGTKAIFFFVPEREKELAALMRDIPGGEVQRLYDCKRLMITTYRVDGPDSR